MTVLEEDCLEASGEEIGSSEVSWNDNRLVSITISRPVEKRGKLVYVTGMQIDLYLYGHEYQIGEDYSPLSAPSMFVFYPEAL